MSDEALLNTRKLKQRYGITDRTVACWEDAGILPTAARIQKRKYWRLSDLERIERESVGLPFSSSNLRTKTA
jgi:DNA-binding transcriptional MerR regulator